MQFFSHILLLLSVSVFCTSGSYHSATHKMQKRQEGVPPPQCLKVVSSEYCSGGYYQEFSDFYVRCNLVDTAIFFRDIFCRQNSNGDFCAVVDVDALNSNIERACNASITALSCMDECRNSISSARADAGCCVNLYNASGGSFNFPYLVDYTLWSQCGIEPVTEECGQSTITLEIPQPIIPGPPTCPDSELDQEMASLNCRESFLESIRDSLEATAGCGGIGFGFYQDFVEQCTVNDAGRYCSSLDSSLQPAFNDAQGNCTNASCNSSCSQALQNFVDIGGCCINHFNMLNSTSFDSPLLWLDYQFWTDCGLETPGLCETRLSTSPTEAATDAVTDVSTDAVTDAATDAATDAVTDISTDSHAAILKAPGLAVSFASALLFVLPYF